MWAWLLGNIQTERLVMDGSKIAIRYEDLINQYFCRSKYRPVVNVQDAGDPVCLKQGFLAGFYLLTNLTGLSAAFSKIAIFKGRGCESGPTCLAQ